MAIDLAPLWDFNKPAQSEERFRNALQTATGDDALVLKTQIARTYGLRKDFVTAQNVLEEMQPQVAGASPEVQVRWWLELGRTYSSATHPPESQTLEVKDKARAAYQNAIDIGTAARLDGLVVDSYHMMAFVDTAPADQIAWANKAMVIVQSSTQPQAKAWEASLRNNIGYALHQMGRNEEALVEFRKALALREQGTNTFMTRVAHWMIAMALRELGRLDDALAIQLQLEQWWDADKEPDPFVYEELEKIYRAKGDEARAAHYAQLLKQSKKD